MSKKYTAQEMRHRADEEQYLWNDSITAAMLRQAADAMEGEERDKKFEYAIVLNDGEVDSVHIDYPFLSGHRIVRRSVGEWEEVLNDNN